MTEKTVLDQKAYILFYMRDPASRSSAGGEQLGTNSSPALRSWLLDGAGDVENEVDSGAEEYEANECQHPLKGNGACCNHSCLYSKGSVQDAANSPALRFSTHKVERVTPVWRL